MRQISEREAARRTSKTGGQRFINPFPPRGVIGE